MKINIKNYIVVVVGFFLLCLGLYLIITNKEPQGIMIGLPYVFIGVGAGIWGHGMGAMIRQKILKRDPNVEKEISIEKSDERNTLIGHRAKAKAFDMMVFLFGILVLTFIVMGIDVIAILLFVFAYVLVIGYDIYYRSKYAKDM